MNLFGTQKLTIAEAQELTVASLNEYGPRHDHWIIAWSGGKDSTTTLILVLYLIMSRQIDPPKRLTVLYADTRMELPPLAISAQMIMARIREIAASDEWRSVACSLEVETVCAPMDKRFFVYILGRGVPPPNNNTLRWCTRQIKVEPMQRRIEDEFYLRNPQCIDEDGERLPPADWPDGITRPMTITGVRLGESAIRDGRIAMSCSRNGAECGQGWYQETLPGDITRTLAPITHWRVCTVWDFLKLYAGMPAFGSWPTSILAEAYGGDQAEESKARTGCNGCPLANQDTALDNVLALYPDEWGYLEPLKRLRPLYRRLRLAENRHRKVRERLKSGKLSKSPNRMGPLTLETRAEALEEILSIQREINAEAVRLGRPPIDTLDAEEEARIRELIAAGVYPNRWSGDEPNAAQPYIEVFQDGSAQADIFISAETLLGS